IEVTQELFAVHDSPRVVMRWTARGSTPARLQVRPLMSGRDYHALHRENPDFSFEFRQSADRVRFQPYAELPASTFSSSGEYRHAPDWYRSFSYEFEAERGLDHIEDLASPGVFSFDLERGPAALVMTGGDPGVDPPALKLAAELADRELRRRGSFA